MTRFKSLALAGSALAATFAVAVFAQSHEMHPPLTRAEVQAKVAEQFKKADTNGDGVITQAEFDARRDAIRKEFEAKREEHRAEAFAMLDTNHDGMLSKQEFVAAGPHGPGGPDMPPPPPGEGPDHEHGGWHGHHMGGFRHGGGMMRLGDKWFDRADANHDGKVTLAEATAAALARFDKADTNHDGTISPEERKAAREAFREHMRDMGK